jgi:hypothetical protein
MLALVLALEGVVAAAGLPCQMVAPDAVVVQAPHCHEMPAAAGASDESAGGASAPIACVLACVMLPLTGNPATILTGGLPDRDWRERAPLPPASPALAGLERPPRSA